MKIKIIMKVKVFLEKFDFVEVLKVKRNIRKNRKIATSKIDIKEKLYHEYYAYYGRAPELNPPKRYSEFLLWQKINFFDEKATLLSDKVKAKEYIKGKFGNEITAAKTLFVFDDARKIDLDKLPSRSIIKCNHNSGYVFLIDKTTSKTVITNLRDKTHKKFRFKTMVKLLNGLLKVNYFYYSYEWNYKDIKPVVFVEEFLDVGDLKDYKFYMNYDRLVAFHVTSDRQNDERNDFFDNELKPMHVWADVPPSDVVPQLPDNINHMIDIARRISSDFPVLRVDLYTIDGAIYFGEATFFHMAGYLDFREPANFDELMGSKMSIIR